jgi:3-dehydroquinate dehydratase
MIVKKKLSKQRQKCYLNSKNSKISTNNHFQNTNATIFKQLLNITTNMKILLINPPVYTPTTFPYSLAAMKGELTAAIDEEITVLDLNASFHYDQFPDFYQRLESIKTKESSENYFTLLEEFYNTTKQTYAQISKAAIQNQEPIGTQEAINQILKHHPNIVAISVTYNSQIFMTKVLINWLQEANKNIKIIIGGPADYSKIIANNPKITNLASAQKLIEYLIANGAKIKETKSISIPDSKKFKEFLALKSTKNITSLKR